MNQNKKKTVYFVPKGLRNNQHRTIALLYDFYQLNSKFFNPIKIYYRTLKDKFKEIGSEVHN